MAICDISMALDSVGVERDAFKLERIARNIMLAAPKVTHVKLILELYESRVSHRSTSYWSVDGHGDDKQLCEIMSSSEISSINKMFLPAPIQVSL